MFTNRWLGRLVRGSVSRYLVGLAACPLLVLPQEAADVSGLDETVIERVAHEL